MSVATEQQEPSKWSQLLDVGLGVVKSYADLDIAKERARYGIEAEDERRAPLYLPAAPPAPNAANAFTADGGNFAGPQGRAVSAQWQRWGLIAAGIVVALIVLVVLLKVLG